MTCDEFISGLRVAKFGVQSVVDLKDDVSFTKLSGKMKKHNKSCWLRHGVPSDETLPDRCVERHVRLRVLCGIAQLDVSSLRNCTAGMFHLCGIAQLGSSCVVSTRTCWSKYNYCLLWLWPVGPHLVDLLITRPCPTCRVIGLVVFSGFCLPPLCDVGVVEQSSVYLLKVVD